MTRHDWIVLAGVVVTILLASAVGMYRMGQADDHIAQLEQRAQRVEMKVDSIEQRTSRIEGYLIHLADSATTRRWVEED